jgi:predicted transcriptional regulator
MDIEEAANYWYDRLRQDQPIYRVKVRRLLTLAGAQRRGYAIAKRIREALDAKGLHTDPDFESAWIDSSVSVRLNDQSEATLPTDERHLGSEIETPITPIDPALDDQPELENSEPQEELAPIEFNEEPITTENTSTQHDDSDPVIRVSRLAAANQTVERCSPSDSLLTATTLMVRKGYSQLPVMQGVRDVKGLVSWESIGMGLVKVRQVQDVRDCMVEAQIIESACSIFDALPIVKKHGYVLVRTKGAITGIITASDLAAEFADISSAFIRIGTIERIIDSKLSPVLTADDFDTLEDNSLARLSKDPADLTLGQKSRLLTRAEVWEKFKLPVDKTQFTKALDEIVKTRNEVMHFDPDPLTNEQKEQLEQTENLLRQMGL